MHVTLTKHSASAVCTWCEKERECVEASFDDGFLKEAPLCWGCLQKSVRVRARQSDAKPPIPKSTS